MEGKKIINYIKSLGWRVWAINIIGIEDWDYLNNKPLPNRFDIFNDTVILIRNTGEIMLSAKATTESSDYWTYHRMNSKGAARIKLDTQFRDAWVVGNHKGQYPALVQIAPITVIRDHNEDGSRIGDREDTGLFGINIHTCGKNASSIKPYNDLIGMWSAGCTVLEDPKVFYERFMPTVIGSGRKTFDYGVLNGDKLSQYLNK